MKKIVLIITVLISFYGYSQSPQPNGTRYNNATKSDTISGKTRIPVLDANNVLNNYTVVDSLPLNATLTTNPDSLLIYTPQKRAAHIPYTDFLQKLKTSLDTIYSASGLEAINEDNGVGYRPIGRNPDNYRNIGLGTFDLTYSETASSEMGMGGEFSMGVGEDINSVAGWSLAIGSDIVQNSTSGQRYFQNSFGGLLTSGGYAAFTFGYDNTNIGHSSGMNFNTVLGRNNHSSTIGGIQAGTGLRSNGMGLAVFGGANKTKGNVNGDWSQLKNNKQPVLVVGNGDINNSDFSILSESDALVVKWSGEVEAPSLTEALIDADTTGYILTTKPWVLSKIAEGSGDNIYTTDGTLPENATRTIDLNGGALGVVDNTGNPMLLITDNPSVGFGYKGSYLIAPDAPNIGILGVATNDGRSYGVIEADVAGITTDSLRINLMNRTPEIGQILVAIDTLGTVEWQTPSGGGGATNAENVIVSPSIGGNTDAYAVMQANRTSIDSIQANMSSGVNTAFRSVTSTAGVFSEAFNEPQPNFRLSLDEDAQVEINDAVNGNFIIAEVVNEDVSEDTFKVTFMGTNKNLISYLDYGEKAYFTMVTNEQDEMIWFRSYEDGKTDKVITVEGETSTKINWSISPYYRVLLGASNDTLSFTPPNESKHLRLEVVQDDIGGREIAFAQTIYFEGGNLPLLSADPDAIDVLDIFYDKQSNRYYVDSPKNNYEEVEGTPSLVWLDVSGKTYNSSGHGSFPPSNSFDGNTSTYSSTTLAQSGWISIDFGTDVTVAQVELLPRQAGGSNSARANGVQLRYSSDGSTWTNVGSPISGVDDNNYTQYVVISFSPVTARYWGWINTDSATYSGNIAEAKFKGYE